MGWRAGQGHVYGLASFDVDAHAPDGKTQIHVRVWDTAPSRGGDPVVFDEFTLQRPRRDTEDQRSGAMG